MARDMLSFICFSSHPGSTIATGDTHEETNSFLVHNGILSQYHPFALQKVNRTEKMLRAASQATINKSRVNGGYDDLVPVAAMALKHAFRLRVILCRSLAFLRLRNWWNKVGRGVSPAPPTGLEMPTLQFTIVGLTSQMTQLRKNSFCHILRRSPVVEYSAPFGVLAAYNHHTSPELLLQM